jgi:hypothetical protein
MIVKEIDLFNGIDPEVMKDIANICTEESAIRAENAAKDARDSADRAEK